MRYPLIWALLMGLVFATAAGCGESAPPTGNENPPPVREAPGIAIETNPVPGLEEVMGSLAEKVFPDYQTVKMDPMDAFPVFQATTSSAFRRLRRRAPVQISMGRAYPRILLKGYEFASVEDLEKEVTVWLNDMESDADDIVLGQEVGTVKSPLLLCGIEGKRFYIVQSACIYDGPEWQADEGRFLAEMKALQADYAWRIKCGDGRLVYDIRPEGAQ